MGSCRVRVADGSTTRLMAYGYPSALALDPVEKKPLFHFFPGSTILSLGTSGCNLHCKHCQNWTLSQASFLSTRQKPLLPDAVVAMAQTQGAISVAFTYNEPIVFMEYALDIAEICHEKGIFTVAVSSGYATPETARKLYSQMDAVNIDLKSFQDDFYRKECSASLAPVLESLQLIRNETNAWLEITVLLIPTLNDSPQEIESMCRWIVKYLGVDVPLHFSAFHPDYKRDDLPATPAETLLRAMSSAKEAGIRFVYGGNLSLPGGEDTRCWNCGQVMVERRGFLVLKNLMQHGDRCSHCGASIAGRF